MRLILPLVRVGTADSVVLGSELVVFGGLLFGLLLEGFYKSKHYEN